MSYRIKTGRLGEREAAAYLEAAGYTIRERRYHTRNGEIDIIAQKDNLIVFVEVKARRNLKYGAPFEAVRGSKSQRMLKVAKEYIYRKRLNEMGFRFDVISIMLNDKDQVQSLEHFTNTITEVPKYD